MTVNTTMYLDSRVAAAFYGNFPRLRDAQKAAVEPLLLGCNVVLMSGTGSGKTEAVVAPIVSKHWKEAVRTDTLFLLYIAPTKALVNDLERRLATPLSTLGLRVGVRHGDRDDLASGPTPHILLTTPESLDVLLFRKDAALMTVRAAVIDEVHLLYNTQRGLQLSILLQRLRRNLPTGLQWAALSATIGDLSHIRDFLMGGGEDTVFLSFPATRVIDAQIRQSVTIGDFVRLVRRLVDGRDVKLLVFANSRRECEKLAGALQEDPSLHHYVFTHYSSLSPEVRLDVEQKFSSMKSAICVATSTLELGIDIGNIDAVLLWGVPSGADSFLQRIGRGNRRSNKTNVICIVPDDSPGVIVDALRFAALIDAAQKGELPIREPFDLFGAVGQQSLSHIASNQGRFTRVADLCSLVEHRQYLSRDIVEAILAELAHGGYLQRHGFKNQFGADEKLYRLVDMRLIYGNFGVASQKIDLFHGAMHIGEIPAINLLKVGIGDRVRFAGRCWSIKKVSRDGIHLDSSKSTANAIDFSYGGNGIPNDPYITDRIWRLIHSGGIQASIFSKDLGEQVTASVEKIRRTCNDKQIPYMRTSMGICYYTFAGYSVNRAVGLFAKIPGFIASDLSLTVPSPLDWNTIPNLPSDFAEIFHLLFEESLAQSLYQKQLPLPLQEREHLQEWLKDKTISNILNRLSGATAVQIAGIHGLRM